MLTRDRRKNPVQGFATKKIISVTSGAAWTPDNVDDAFRVNVICGYYLGTDSSHDVTLQPGWVVAISEDVTSYTFDSDMNIEVM